MAKNKDLKREDFKEDVKSKKGLINPLKNLLKQKPSKKKTSKK